MTRKAQGRKARSKFPLKPLLYWEQCPDWHAMEAGHMALEAQVPWDPCDPEEPLHVYLIVDDRGIRTEYSEQVLYSTKGRRSRTLIDVLYETEKWAKRVLKASRKQGRFDWSEW